mgnify:CR=1 FL=1
MRYGHGRHRERRAVAPGAGEAVEDQGHEVRVRRVGEGEERVDALGLPERAGGPLGGHLELVRLDDLVALYAWHGAHHVAHITSLRRAQGW